VKPISLDGTCDTARSGQPGSEAGPFCLDIEIHEDEGSVRVFDPRVFHAGRRPFCRRLIEATARRPGVRKAEIDLTSASCRIDFDPGPGRSQAMAVAFADSVREAASASPRADRPSWWRPSPGWSVLTAYPLAGDVSLWETQEVKPGRIRLRHQMLAGDSVPLSQLVDKLAGLEDVQGCRVSFWSRTMIIDFRPESPVADRFPDVLEQALEDLLTARTSGRGSSVLAISSVNGELVEVATGLKRFRYLALAGGSFALTLAALVIPGLPTVPCLLATSYYLARSSPRLDRMLRRTVFFGPILTQWEQHHALSGSSKRRLMGMTVVLVVVTFALTSLTPVAVVVILVVASLSILGVFRLPALPEEGRGAIRAERPARLALAAP
jgi:uncharacterized membrane protein YbaN (DUF454 family)